MLGNKLSAEDAAQDAFIRAHKFFDRFDVERPLAPWLKRIAVNVCLNRINADNPASSLDDNLPPPKDPHPGPELADRGASATRAHPGRNRPLAAALSIRD